MRGADRLIQALLDEGVDTVFGMPGGASLSIHDALEGAPIRHVLVRHEAGAGHAAEGYAKATGRVGVALVTSGPGATNLMTPDRRRVHGLGADGVHHRPGGQPPARLDGLPGVRRDRDDAPRRPVLYAGGGVGHSDASDVMTELARRLDLPELADARPMFVPGGPAREMVG